MNHPRRLAQEQLVSAADETSMVGVKKAVGGVKTAEQTDGALVSTT